MCFIGHLLEYQAQFFGKEVHEWGIDNLTATKEGQDAVQEAIEFLRNQEPMQKLTWSEDIRKAARDHANDCGPKGLIGTVGSDGSELPERLKRYGNVELGMGQSNIFGKENALKICIDLLICDGDVARTNRHNLFNTVYN